MIRVTNHRGETITYPTSFLHDGTIIEEMMYGQVTKIEKQVKDLTIEECRKLGISNIFPYVNSVSKKDDATYYLTYNDDDYIDITKIIKGETMEYCEHCDEFERDISINKKDDYISRECKNCKYYDLHYFRKVGKTFPYCYLFKEIVEVEEDD